MDFTIAVSIIKKDLEEARSLLDQLSLTPGEPVVELELARSRVRSALELLALLPRLTEEISFREVPRQKAPESIEKKQEIKPQHEEKTEKIKAESVDEQKIEPTDESVAGKSPETMKTILADKFNDSGRLGNQVMSVTHDEIISSAMSAKPIADIASAIGINDKFYYIRELFSGDSKAYQDTIKRLNASESLGEAMKILDDSTVMGSDAAAQSAFVDVVRRKFNIDG